MYKRLTDIDLKELLHRKPIKTNRIYLVCKNCNEKFIVFKSVSDWRRYCSKACSDKRFDTTLQNKL